MVEEAGDIRAHAGATNVAFTAELKGHVAVRAVHCSYSAFLPSIVPSFFPSFPYSLEASDTELQVSHEDILHK